MKFETLITRYKNLGYSPRGLEPEVELECIINWIYKTFDVFILLSHHDPINIKAFRKHIPEVDKFIAHKIWNCNDETPHTIYAEKYFNNPFDAKFDTVKQIYKVLRFRTPYQNKREIVNV
jgi:hypothetical protein